jgi:hypothetical protein
MPELRRARLMAYCDLAASRITKSAIPALVTW